MDEEKLQLREMNSMLMQAIERTDDKPEHRHTWIAAEWEYATTAPIKRITKLYCPDCKQTQKVEL